MNPLKAFFHAEWPKLAEVWPARQAEFAVQTRAATELVLSLAEIEPGLHVLDLACGAGEPALSLARAVGPNGKVVATDLVPGAVELVRERARAEGLTTLSGEVADAEALPFPDAVFSRVTCRLGAMFFADVERALREVRRVLVPRGRAAFVAWGDPEQALFRSTLGEMPASCRPGTSPDRPGPFRFARAGTLRALLAGAGFESVSEQTFTLCWPFPGPAELAWRAFRELAGPSLQAELDALSTAERAGVEARIVANLRRYEREGVTDPGASVVGAAGCAP